MAREGDAFVNNNGGTTRSVKNLKCDEVGTTRDGIQILDCTYENSQGQTEGYIALKFPDRNIRLVQWTGYKIESGQKKAWHWSRVNDSDYVRRQYSSQLPLRG